MYYGVHEKVRGQLLGIDSLFNYCGSGGGEEEEKEEGRLGDKDRGKETGREIKTRQDSHSIKSILSYSVSNPSASWPLC